LLERSLWAVHPKVREKPRKRCEAAKPRSPHPECPLFNLFRLQSCRNIVELRTVSLSSEEELEERWHRVNRSKKDSWRKT
jgi:hypothetical protein